MIFRAIFGFLRRHRWKSLAVGIVTILIVYGVVWAMRPKQPEYVTAVAEKKDLRQTVEAVGTVISERDLELQFRSSGIVSSVFVKEGDRVRAGQRLAQLRSGSLGASVASASARVQEADANLRALREGTRPEEIAIAEADLANKKASLDVAKQTLATAEKKLAALKSEVEVSLQGQVNVAGSTLLLKLTTSEQSLAAIDDVYSNNDVEDAVLRDRPDAYQDLRALQTRARDAIRSASTMAMPVDYRDALASYDQARSTIQLSVQALSAAYDLLAGLPETSYLSSADKETHKATLATKRSSAQTALTDLDVLAKQLRDSAAGYDTQITAEEGVRARASADILTYESQVRSGEAQLALKKAGARPTDIQAAEARWRQARADLARASADYGDTVLTAPIEGIVTKVLIKVGEYTPVGAAVTVLGNTPFRVETFVSEIDIPKVQRSQSGSIELDAFPGMHYKVHVSEIDPVTTDVDGVPKYRVKLDFVYPHEEFRVGMSGDTEIITGMRPAVVTVPRRAIIEEEGKAFVRVLGDDGEVEERTVTVGMEGEGGDTEIMSGLSGGEIVIVLEKK